MLSYLPSEQQLSLIQKFISDISDLEERKYAETLIMVGRQFKPEKKKKHITVLIHGIRTHASWQERLARRLGTLAPEVEVSPVGYDWFPALQLVIPIFTRNKPIQIVLEQLRTIRSNNPDADISVVAHSFGTYIISIILKKYADIKLNRIQLCGSIIPTNYDWALVKPRISGTIVNDVGTKDRWPSVAKHLSWGYGSSGRYGFKQYLVKDNFHDLGHSDYFTDEHQDKYWIPFLIDGQIIYSSWNTERKN